MKKVFSFTRRVTERPRPSAAAAPAAGWHATGRNLHADPRAEAKGPQSLKPKELDAEAQTKLKPLNLTAVKPDFSKAALTGPLNPEQNHFRP